MYVLYRVCMYYVCMVKLYTGSALNPNLGTRALFQVDAVLFLLVSTTNGRSLPSAM
jgi:hypothetical protein